ncbi:hypothetical protein ABIE52_000065 [Rhodococcus sp. OAS809]
MPHDSPCASGSPTNERLRNGALDSYNKRFIQQHQRTPHPQRDNPDDTSTSFGSVRYRHRNTGQMGAPRQNTIHPNRRRTPPLPPPGRAKDAHIHCLREIFGPNPTTVSQPAFISKVSIPAKAVTAPGNATMPDADTRTSERGGCTGQVVGTYFVPQAHSFSAAALALLHMRRSCQPTSATEGFQSGRSLCGDWCLMM